MRRRLTTRDWIARVRVEARRAAATLALLCALGGLGTWAYLRGLWSPYTSDLALEPALSLSRQFDTAQQLEAIAAALDVYRIRHGALPESLRDVVAAGLLTHVSLTQPGYRGPYYYERQDAGAYVLLPPTR